MHRKNDSLIEALKQSQTKKEDDHIKNMVEDHIVDINNKLVDICSLLNLDLQDIKPIHPNKDIRKENSAQQNNSISDDEKRAIVSAIQADERKDAIREEAMKAAGITEEEYQNLSKTIKDFSNGLEGINNIKNAQAPPKTEWSKITVDSSEKDKIIKSIRANKNSKHIFSKEFKWRPEEFLEAFNYLEESKGYTGPFLTALVDNKSDLEKLAKSDKLKEGIHSMYLGKYVVLSVYDITAEAGVSAKQMYIGLEYLNMVGRLKFHALTTIGIKTEIKQSQKTLVKEYLDAMDIIYEEEHSDLT